MELADGFRGGAVLFEEGEVLSDSVHKVFNLVPLDEARAAGVVERHWFPGGRKDVAVLFGEVQGEFREARRGFEARWYQSRELLI